MDRKSAVRLSFLALASAAVVIVAACGDDDDDKPPPPPPPPASDAGPRGLEQAGQACTAPTQCYLDRTDGGTDAGDAEAGAQLAIRGTITCLDKVPNGYCTHECKDDTDCCAAPGECRTGVKQVCSPFTNESTIKYCFLSCEDGDINRAIAANADAGYYDGGALDAGSREDEYCKSYASIYATCRSSGGGNQNRKVCIPQQ